MNQLQIFNFGSNEVRTVLKDGDVWFVAKDVCEVLEIKNPTMAMQKLDEDERTKFNLGRQGETNIINESGLYTLVMTSRKPEAKRFKKWVTNEVLPSIRKHGAYMTDDVLEQAVNNPDFMIGLLTKLKEEKEKNKALETKTIMLEQQVAENASKITYLDQILQSKDTVTVSQIAAGYGLSATKLNNILNKEGVQYKVNGQWLLYAKHRDKGYTKSKTIDVTHSNGSKSVKMNTRWTQKGRLFIHEILTKQGIIPTMDREEVSA